jgi:putative tryptophan/tyrosine transport system substrate-binding protein
MRRRDFIAGLSGAASWPVGAWAQQGKVGRIGFLRYAAPNAAHLEAFRHGLRDLGYVEGRNVIIEERYASGVYDRLPAFVAELIALRCDVIVIDGTATAKVVQATTNSVPIVFTLAADPVADGLAVSLSRPGGNFTGLTFSVGYEIAGKRVDLLKEVVPTVSRVAVLANPANPTNAAYLATARNSSTTLGMQIELFEVPTASELSNAFSAMMKWPANGLITLNDAMLFSQRDRISQLAASSGLPGVYPEAEFVRAGGLMAYGPSLSDLFQRAATYVQKILNGSRPADIPIEQPTKFELAFNLKTAKGLGLKIPESFLIRADEVIE